MKFNPITRAFRIVYKFLVNQADEDESLIFGNWGCGLFLFFILAALVFNAIGDLFS